MRAYASVPFSCMAVLASGLAPGSPARAQSAGDVPLVRWTSDAFPDGVDLGATNGVSLGDFDRDGWVDIYAMESRSLWRNDAGESWTRIDLTDVFPPRDQGRVYYGASFGDFDADGYPDLITEPRSGACSHILQNVGGTGFEVISTDPERVDTEACFVSSETACWGDVDGDGLLDVLLPAYAFSGVEDRNYFWHNQGPNAVDGLFTFAEKAIGAGFVNPAPINSGDRPEGAQFVDTDFDGDLDFYTDGHLYQNVSAVGVPAMRRLDEDATGISFATVLEEGAAFADYDMDGDYDLLVVYTPSALGVMIWENRGDGTFALAERDVVEAPDQGLNLGLSVEDWDNDGDMDLTTRMVFRQNMWRETGMRRFVVAPTHGIPAADITSATPAWGDLDRDGDLDTALGNWRSNGHVYENVLYDEATPDEARRYLRVRPVNDSATVEGGVETEFGASVELIVRGEEGGDRRKKFTQSGSGYLNQNEYTLHFALPEDPAPGDPTRDLFVDVVVDFPSLPEQGLHRVDRHVNPALGDVDVAQLAQREIVVYRSGDVEIDGTRFPGALAEGPTLTTAAGGLAVPERGRRFARPSPTPTGRPELVGLQISTFGAARRVRLREVLVDGLPAAPVVCGGDGGEPSSRGNLFVWDVTDRDARRLRAAIDVPLRPRNHRHHVPVDVLLERDRRYWVLARVSELRESPAALPVAHDDATVEVSLRFPGDDPCGGPLGVGAGRADALYASARWGALDVDPCDACSPDERCVVDRCEPVTAADAGPPIGDADAGPIADAGAPAGPVGGSSDGCDCRVPARGDLPSAAWLAIAVAGVAARGRRSKGKTPKDPGRGGHSGGTDRVSSHASGPNADQDT